MEERMEKVNIWKCKRCGHEWIPRKKEKPRFCPKCRSIYWDTPKINKKKRE